ncbi:MAG: ZIP family metal transporter [Chryseolinea sp.]
MPFKLLVLFLTPLLAGLLIYLVPKNKDTNFKLLLAFAGSYLFAITVIHILPELYRAHDDIKFIGLAVLGGFFLQQLLEYFTAGIEHGHMHLHKTQRRSHEGHEHGQHHTHGSKSISALVLLAALCIHAFLEGAMLAKPTITGTMYNIDAILLGIVLHRAPAAFALMTVLAHQLRSRIKALPHLVAFSMAAPVGLLLSTFLVNHEVLSATGLLYVYAVTSGNFLHISTTIVFESSPEHRFNAKRMAVTILGSLLAVAVEYVV